MFIGRWLGTGQWISLRTVSRRAIQLGLRSRRPVIRAPLEPVHCQTRLNSCCVQQNWGIKSGRILSSQINFAFTLNANSRNFACLSGGFWRRAYQNTALYGGGSIIVGEVITLNYQPQLAAWRGFKDEKK